MKSNELKKIKDSSSFKNNLSNGLKILITTGIYPPDIGGPATYLIQFTKFLLKNNCEIRVITFSDVIEDKKYDSEFKVIRVLRNCNVFFRLIKYFIQIMKNSRDIDIIYLHDVSLCGLALLFANLFIKKKYIVRVGGDVVWEQAYQKGLIKEKYFEFYNSKQVLSFSVLIKRFLSKQIYKNACKVIVPSEFLKKTIRTYNITDNKIEVIHNAIDYSYISNIDNYENEEILKYIKNERDNGNKIFISNGRLVNLKRFDYLINIFSNVSSAKLLIIGSGPEEEKLTQLIKKLKLENKVMLTGKIDREKLLHLYSLSDAFILLSIVETFSFATLEALLFGVRVILSKQGAFEEIFGEFNNRGVEFVDLNNKQSIIHMLNNIDNIKQINQEGIKRLKEKFNYEKHLDNVYNIILNIVK